MTTLVQFVTVDNLDKQRGVLTATGDDGETVIVALNGRVRELDLTAGHAKELRELLAPYLEAGHEPGAPPQQPEQQAPGPLKGQGRRREIPGTRDFYTELRDWAAEAGIEIKTAGTGTKRNYVYRSVLPGYLAHLERQAARGGLEGDAARARLAMARLLGLLPAEHPGPAGS